MVLKGDMTAGLIVLGVILLVLVITSWPDNPGLEIQLDQTDVPTATEEPKQASAPERTPPRRSTRPTRPTSTTTHYAPTSQPTEHFPTSTLEPTVTEVRPPPNTPTIHLAPATVTLGPSPTTTVPSTPAPPSPSATAEPPTTTSTRETMPNVHIVETSCGTQPEWIAIKNDGAIDQDMTGWQLHDERDNPVPFVFPNGYRLPVGYEVKVWSYGTGPGSEFNLDWTRRAVWNNDRDVIFLRDQSGRLVAERSC